MKHVKMTAAAAFLLLGATGMAHSVTLAGTSIRNEISISYGSGGGAPTLINNAANVTFLVDREVDLIVEGMDAGKLVTVPQGFDDAVLTFRVTNEGNSRVGYIINPVRVASGGDFAANYSPTAGAGDTFYYFTKSPDPTPGPSEIVFDPYTGNSQFELDPGQSYYIRIHQNVAFNANDDAFQIFRVNAEAAEPGTSTKIVAAVSGNLNVVDTVFTDPGPVFGAEFDDERINVNAPVLTATKTVTVISENTDGTFDCAAGAPGLDRGIAISGSCVEYTISVSNAADAGLAAPDLMIEDLLPPDTQYASHSVGTFDTVEQLGGFLVARKSSLPIGQTINFTVRAMVRN